MGLSELQKRRFQKYQNSNQTIFSDRVVQGFFQKDENIILLLSSLEGDQNKSRELDEKFRKHFFQIRFVKYMLSTIKYCSFDQIRLNQKINQRNQLIFDRPASDDGEGAITLGEMLLFKQALPPQESTILDPNSFESSINCDKLRNAFSSLSQKQQMTLTLSYAMCYNDVEIAKMTGVSPVAVSKTRNLALKKLKHSLSVRGGD